MTDKANAPYPYLGINGEYFDKAVLQGVEAEIVRKLPIWQAGLERPSECEKFVYYVLKQIKMNEDWHEG